MANGGTVEFNFAFDLSSVDRAFAAAERRLGNRDLELDIKFDTDGLTRAASSSSGILQGIFQGIGQQLTSIITSAFQSAFNALRGIIGGAISDFATFEQSIVQFAGRARASVDSVAELETLTAKAANRFSEIGAATSKTPEEVASIATRMVELGAAADETLDSVDDVVAALEATGFTDVDDTAKAFQVATQIFGTSSEDLADKFALLANTTAVTSSTDLLQVFSKAGGAAADLGVEIDELLTIFASFRDAGATPEVAATATRNAIQKLAAPTDTAKKALDELGVSFFDAAGAARSPIDVLGDLDSALAGFTDEQRVGFLTDIFDSQSASQLSGILGQLDGRVAQTFDNLSNNAEGFAKDSQDALNQGPIAALVRLQSALQVLRVSFGGAFGAGFESIIRGFTEVIQFVTQQEGLFDGLRAGSEALADAFDNINIGDSLAPALTEIIRLISDGIGNALANLAGFFENNSSAVDEFLNRLVLGVQTVGNLINIFGQLTAQVIKFAQSTGAFERAIAFGEAFARVIDAIANRGLEGLVDEFTGLSDALNQSDSLIAQVFGGLTRIIEININLFKRFNDAFEAAFDVGVIDGLIQGVGTLINLFVQLDSFIRGQVSAAIGGLLAPLNNVIASLEGITAAQGDSSNAVEGGVKAGINAINGAFSEVASNAEKTASEIGGAFEDSETQGVNSTRQSEAEKAKIREDALAEFERSNNQALAAIEQSASSRIAAIREQVLSGDLGEGQAEVQIASIEADTANDRVAQKQAELSEIQRLQNEGVLSEQDAADQILAIQTEIGDLNLARINAEIAAQEAAKQAALDKLNSELEAAQQLQEARSIEFDIASEALTQQQNLLDAQLGLAQARNTLEDNRLNNALEAAQAAGNETKAAQIRAQIQEQQLAASEQEFAAKRQALDISQQQAAIDNQRAITQAEIAALEADIAFRAAQTEGASADQLSVLQQIADLRSEQVDSARDAAALQNEINSIDDERLSIEQQIAAEQLDQVDNIGAQTSAQSALNRALSETKKRQEDIARAQERVTSALFQSGETSSDFRETIDNARERFSAASAAGIDVGSSSEFNQAASRLESLLSQNANDTQLLRFAQEFDDNAFASELLGAVGRSDIANLAEAGGELDNLTGGLKQANEGIENRLDTLNENVLTLANSPRSLTAITPNASADVAAIASSMTRQSQRNGGR